MNRILDNPIPIGMIWNICFNQKLIIAILYNKKYLQFRFDAWKRTATGDQFPCIGNGRWINHNQYEGIGTSTQMAMLDFEKLHFRIDAMFQIDHT